MTQQSTFRPDTSFPYLKIANDHGIPYGEVIRYAAVLDIGQPLDPDWIVTGHWHRDVVLAWREERDRRIMAGWRR